MSVMPLPHFRTLYLHNVGAGCKLSTELPSLAELGRLHFTKGEALRAEKEKKMAFTLVDKETLPVAEFGRKATNPRIGVAGNGQITFNSLISKAWEGVDRLIVQYDAETNRVLFIGVKKGAKTKIDDKKMFSVKAANIKDKETGKTTPGNMFTAASSFLKNVAKYDYTAAGNQIYDAELNEKTGGYIITLPRETPAPRPVKARKAKATVVATVESTQQVNGAIKSAPVVEAPAESELVLEV